MRFGFEIETVAGLDLNRRDTFRDQPVEPRETLRDEFVFPGGARRSHGR
jgi:hypothetical protein